MGFWNRKRSVQEGEEMSEEIAGQDEGALVEGAPSLPESERLLRLQADFENFRRRNATARAEAADQTRQQLLSDLLPVYDNFLRAKEHAGSAPPEAQPFLEGFDAIRVQLEHFFRGQGLAEVSAEPGEVFDPSVHEATGAIPAPSPDLEGHIAQVLRKGFKLGGITIRPAAVLVYSNQ